MKTPLRIGIIGMGGYAGSHQQALLKLEEKQHARLVCTCDPQASQFGTQQEKWQFARRGVRVFADYVTMLDTCGAELDLVVIPTPIPLHAAMHRACVDRRICVYLEKPPTLDPPELEDMILRDHLAPKATLVGFNFIIERARLALKERLLAGEFGAIRETHLAGEWPRPTTYFSRNGWAGRLIGEDGRVVLDSCFGNAMAHFVHNMLFWAGEAELMSWARLATVQAELFRAHDIEGADTFFVEARTAEGVVMRFALTHACNGAHSQSETVVCERATLRYIVGRHAEIRWHDGRVERTALEPFDPLVENHLDYYRFLRGENDRPATLLRDSRPFVALNGLAYVSSGEITAFPNDRLTRVRNETEQKDYFAVAGLQTALATFLATGEWPSAKGWRTPPGRTVAPAELGRLHEVVRAMRG